jgi:hypothetical protein
MFCSTSTCLVCFYSHKFSILQKFEVEELSTLSRKGTWGVKELHKSNSGKNTSIKAMTYNIKATLHQKLESA